MTVGYGPNPSMELRRSPEGGELTPYTNKTGAPSVKGTVVEADTTTDDAVKINDASGTHPIGVMYSDGVADGGRCLVVTAGPAQVLLKDTTSATKGYWCATHDVAGRADCTQAVPPSGGAAELQVHMQELGHCTESVTGGNDQLAWITVHPN